jgi:hypothetical protein
MERSRFIAKLIGPVCIAGGIGLLFNADVHKAMFEHGLHDHLVIYLSGVISLTIGLAIVILHNRWGWHWPVIVTIFGWLGVIGGAVRMILPQAVEQMGAAFIAHPSFLVGDGIFAVLLGVLLSYFGYFDPPQVHGASRRRRR